MVDDPSGNLSDADLLLFVNTLRQRMPTVGEGLLTGSLRSHGYHISRAKARTALRSSDPLGQALRWPGVVTYRRPYSVAGPNSLWHIGTCIHIHIYKYAHHIYWLLVINVYIVVI